MRVLRVLSIPAACIVLLLAATRCAQASDRTISFDVEVSQQAINRFIAAQTFPHLYDEYYDGKWGIIEYEVWITTPVVTLNTNSATVSFTLTAWTSLWGTVVIPVNAAITIPSGAIALSQVSAVMVNFPTFINNNPNLQPWLRSVIIAAYNGMQFTTFPSRILDQANSVVPTTIDAQVIDFGLAWAALPQKLKLTVSAVVRANPPTFSGQWMKRAPYQGSIRFGANVSSNIKRVLVHWGTGSELYRNEGLDVPIAKGGNSVQIDLSGLSVTTYYVTVLFGSNNGQYLRRYAFIFNTATYNTWFGMTPTNGID
jgi:hypothetical protein